MNDQAQPQIKGLILDWQIDALFDLTGAIVTFLVLPWGGPDKPREAKPLPPMGMNLEELRRLRGDLDELIALMERNPGTPDGAH